MRPFEWLIALVVLTIAAQWALGRRAALGQGLVGGFLIVAQVALEGQRIVMWPAYLVIGIALFASLRRSTPMAPRGGGLRVAGRGIGALIIVALGVGVPWLWPVMKLPRPTGPFGVGTAWMVVRDSTRHERFGPARGAVREVPVKLWYPIPAGTTGKSAPYAVPEEPNVAGMIPSWLDQQVTLIKTHSIVGAPVDTTRPIPVLVFSHGYTGFAEQNTPQMEELASRGYLVASIAHTGEASWTPFPDGTGVPLDTGVMNGMRRLAKDEGGGDPKRTMDSLTTLLTAADPVARHANLKKLLTSTGEPLRSESVREWSADTKALIDVLAMMHAGSVQSPFKGRLDLRHIGVFGMSYGGATAGEFCRQDSRCQAAINIDGAQYGGLIDDSLTVPFMILASEQAYPVHVPVLDLTRAPAFLARVPATNHVGLTDRSLQAPTLFRWLGLTGRLDSDRREAIMTAFVLGFFEKYLMGRSPELFDSLKTKFPEVQITSRNTP